MLEETANQEQLSEEGKVHSNRFVVMENMVCGSQLAIHESSERSSEIRGDLLLDPQVLRWGHFRLNLSTVTVFYSDPSGVYVGMRGFRFRLRRYRVGSIPLRACAA